MKFTQVDKKALHERLNFLDRLKDSKDISVSAQINAVMADAYEASQQTAKKVAKIYDELEDTVKDINTDKLAKGTIELADKLNLKEGLFENYEDSRGATTRLISLLDNNILDANTLVKDLLNWMSDDDVAEFIVAYDLDPVTDDLYESKCKGCNKDTCECKEKETVTEARTAEPIYDNFFDEIWLQLSSNGHFTDKQIHNKGPYSEESESDDQQLAYYRDVPDGYTGIAVYGKTEKDLEYAKKVADKYADWVTTKPVPSRNVGNVGKGNTVGIVIMVPDDVEAPNLDDERIRQMKKDTIERRRANREAKRLAKEQETK